MRMATYSLHRLQPPRLSGLAGGELYGVGDNYFGQLGLGQTNSVESWGKVSSASAGWGSSAITSIAAGCFHTLVVAGVAADC